MGRRERKAVSDATAMFSRTCIVGVTFVQVHQVCTHARFTQRNIVDVELKQIAVILQDTCEWHRVKHLARNRWRIDNELGNPFLHGNGCNQCSSTLLRREAGVEPGERRWRRCCCHCRKKCCGHKSTYCDSDDHCKKTTACGWPQPCSQLTASEWQNRTEQNSTEQIEQNRYTCAFL